MKLTIGSRGSDLALYQANFIKDILTRVHACSVEIKIIKTEGDELDKLSFDKMEGKGFFTKELEDSLMLNQIDLAVHSLKDLMTTQPVGLKLGAAGYRADRREILLIRKESHTSEGLIPVKDGGNIGTSSARRKAQIAFHNNSLKITDLRGNVPTRVQKLRDGNYDAIIIAAAGVIRLKLNLDDLEVKYLDPHLFLPAPAQGILGIQIRENNPEVEQVVSKLGSRHEMKTAHLERGLLARFDAGCSLPLGIVSEFVDDSFSLTAVLGERSGNDWKGLKRTKVTGHNTQKLIAEAFEILSGTSARCV